MYYNWEVAVTVGRFWTVRRGWGGGAGEGGGTQRPAAPLRGAAPSPLTLPCDSRNLQASHRNIPFTGFSRNIHPAVCGAMAVLHSVEPREVPDVP